MNFSQAVAICFKRYSKCSGEASRASRSEYWYWSLFCVISAGVAFALDTVIFHIPLDDDKAVHPLYMISGIIVLLPSINVGIRRLHDMNKSGWWLLLGCIPYFIGPVLLLLWSTRKGTAGPNDYGFDPLQA